MTNNNQVLLTGLSLIHDSPFRSSQSPVTKQTSTFEPAKSGQYDDFSTLLNFLKTDYNEHLNNNGVIVNPNPHEDSDSDLNYLNDSYKYYLLELSNTLMDVNNDGKINKEYNNLKDIKLSSDIKALFNITKNNNTNDLILKILIENSLYNLNQYLDCKNEYDFIQASLKGYSERNPIQASNNSVIMSLDEIKSLKSKILALYEEKTKLQANIEETVESLEEILGKYAAQEPINKGTYKPSSRQSRLEIENINLINNQLERQLVGSSLKKYIVNCEALKSLEVQLENHKKKLFSHFFTCLIIGFINNITINLKLQKNLLQDKLSPCTTPKSTTFDSFKSPIMDMPRKSSLQMAETAIFNKSIEEIVSHVASIAVQKDISLPEPDMNNIVGKTNWVKSCISTILSHNTDKLAQESNLRENVHLRKKNMVEDNISDISSETSVTSMDFSPNKQIQNISLGGKLNSPKIIHESPYNSRSSSNNNNHTNTFNDLKTKVKDLKFANEYLTKQFKTERESFNKILAEQNLAKLNLEKKLNSSIESLEKTNALLIQNELVNQDLQQKLDENFNTINILTKQITDLKIENLGSNSPKKLTKQDFIDIPSPDHGISSSREGVNTHHEFLSTSSLQTVASNSSVGATASPSVGIMRQEFKKIIDDINNKHFIELSNQITERKRLENLVKMYKENMSKD